MGGTFALGGGVSVVAAWLTDSERDDIQAAIEEERDRLAAIARGELEPEEGEVFDEPGSYASAQRRV